MRKGVLLSLSCSLLTLTFAEAAPRVEWEIVQPAGGEQELTLFSRPGRVKVRLGDETQSYALREGERLTHAVALRDGWAAAGSVASDGRSRMVIVRSAAGRLERLELDHTKTPDLQLRPRLMTRDGRLTGVAWLEGPTLRKTEVKARQWLGGDWGEATTVSRRGRGSQTGLATATLRNGNELLVWSAFDGNDDEIRFSVARGGNWSAPRALTAGNRVPDVAPAVVALDRGALAAWSRRTEEGYELVLARYRGGEWRELGSLGEGLFARFVQLDGRTFLLARSAAPRGWQALELDKNGRVLRRSTVLATGPEAPELSLMSGLGVELRWPARESRRGYWDTP